MRSSGRHWRYAVEVHRKSRRSRRRRLSTQSSRAACKNPMRCRICRPCQQHRWQATWVLRQMTISPDRSASRSQPLRRGFHMRSLLRMILMSPSRGSQMRLSLNLRARMSKCQPVCSRTSRHHFLQRRVQTMASSVEGFQPFRKHHLRLGAPVQSSRSLTLRRTSLRNSVCKVQAQRHQGSLCARVRKHLWFSVSFLLPPPSESRCRRRRRLLVTKLSQPMPRTDSGSRQHCRHFWAPST
mmetsp:Transcript_32739/g.83083  ORF Transcript_32739/g.83083 Transcript_32739/m.83083 type:complete len:240 (-) Transcript_32739:999-1718(-)